MAESIIAEGKTTNEAIEAGLKILKTSKDKVEIKVLEQEEKKSFFSILSPRTVKVELKLKEGVKSKTEKTVERKERKIEISAEDMKKAEENVKNFLNAFLVQLKINNLDIKLSTENGVITVEINGDNINYLIGYRGDVLNSLQSILNNVANKGIEGKCKVILDIENYRSKREKTLQELAEKVARTVVKNKKAVILEPMTAYERKIIHSKLQEHPKVKTHSIGEEPNRKIVIELK